MDSVKSRIRSSSDEFALETSITPKILPSFVWGFLVILVLYEFWFRNSRGYKLLRNIPGPMRWPIIGNSFMAVGLNSAEMTQMALQLCKEYGETISGSIGNFKIVSVSNPADIEIILNSQDHLEKADEYRYFKPWFGDGLLISNGKHWQHHRKMIAPTFHQSILKSFVPKFAEHSRRVADELVAKVGTEFDVHEHMSQVTVQILLSTAMGMQNLPEGQECKKYAAAVIDMCEIIQKRQVKLAYRYDLLYNLTQMRKKGDKLMNTILSLTKRVVRERCFNFNSESVCVLDTEPQAMDKGKDVGLRDDLDDIDESDVGAKRRLALMDAMVNMSKDPNVEWTEKDILDEVNTIMFEGHDTTSAGSSFVLCLLGIHRDVQDKVYEEQRLIFGADMQRDCMFADTLQMNYLERVIKETFRLYPPVPLIARKINQDVKLASGPYTIPRGTTVIIGYYLTHRRGDLYENPEKFDPDNFLPEKVSKRHYYSYIPFSAGPRSCVGRKYAMLLLKVLLSTLVRKFHIHTNHQESDFKLQGDIILKIHDGFKIELKART